MNPFLRPDAGDFPDIFTDAVVHILEVGGVGQLSVRAIARWMKVTPGAILNEYSRAVVLDLVSICFTERWTAWSGSGAWWARETELPLRLPETDDERHGVRVRQALEQLAWGERQRGNPRPVSHFARLRRDEERMLQVRLRRWSSTHAPASDDQVTTLLATIEGLRTMLAEDQPMLCHARARQLVLSSIEAMTSLKKSSPVEHQDEQEAEQEDEAAS